MSKGTILSKELFTSDRIISSVLLPYDVLFHKKSTFGKAVVDGFELLDEQKRTDIIGRTSYCLELHIVISSIRWRIGKGKLTVIQYIRISTNFRIKIRRIRTHKLMAVNMTGKIMGEQKILPGKTDLRTVNMGNDNSFHRMQNPKLQL